MRRIAALTVLSIALLACDDGDEPPVADAAADQGGLLDQEPGPDGEPVDQGPPPDMDPGRDQAPPPTCDPAVGYGLQSRPAPLSDQPASTARLIWTGTQWGLTWQGPGGNPDDPDLRRIYFQRLGGDGALLGEPVTLGVSKSPAHALAWTGTRFMAAFVSVREAGEGHTGITVQALDADGNPDGAPNHLNASFDATHLALAYAQGATGLIVYSRGLRQAGADGLFARALNERGAPEGQPLTLTPGAVLSPTVSYGDGNFGIAWLDRDSPRPLDVAFALVSLQGRIVGSRRRIAEAGAQGQIHLAYGASAYGIGWSAVDNQGELKPRLSLFDLNGDPLDEVPVEGPEGFGLITDVTWLNPNFFGVAWQDNAGSQQSVGLTRITPAGSVSRPVRIPVEPGVTHGPAAVAGTISRAGLIFTRDPEPQPAGYSAGARLQFTTLAPCR